MAFTGICRAEKAPHYTPALALVECPQMSWARRRLKKHEKHCHFWHIRKTAAINDCEALLAACRNTAGMKYDLHL